MSSIVSKKHPSNSSEENAEDQEQIDEKINSNLVTSHVYLKPAHSAGTLEKEVVLRRIRHRKRVNQVKKAVQSLLISSSSPFSSSRNIDNSNKVAAPQIIKWADDAFAAP